MPGRRDGLFRCRPAKSGNREVRESESRFPRSRPLAQWQIGTLGRFELDFRIRPSLTERAVPGGQTTPLQLARTRIGLRRRGASAVTAPHVTLPGSASQVPEPTTGQVRSAWSGLQLGQTRKSPIPVPPIPDSPESGIGGGNRESLIPDSAGTGNRGPDGGGPGISWSELG
jgi:hypothetical protein